MFVNIFYVILLRTNSRITEKLFKKRLESFSDINLKNFFSPAAYFKYLCSLILVVSMHHAMYLIYTAHNTRIVFGKKLYNKKRTCRLQNALDALLFSAIKTTSLEN